MLFKKDRPRAAEAEIMRVRERAQRIRQQIGSSDVRLADLFGLIGEDEHFVPEARREQVETIRRYRPDEV